MEIKEITLETLIKMQSLDQQFKLVDVRDYVHYQKEHIKNAISIPIKEIREQAEKFLKKDEIIVVYCVSFDCPLSSTATKILLSMGFNNVLCYSGGFLEYRAAKLPTEKDASTIHVTVNDKPITLVGRELKKENMSPNFNVVNSDLEAVTLYDFANKIKVITTFPSLDTPVCDLQIKAFNEKATTFASNVVVLAISKDLPFAQKRFCDTNNIKNVVLLSDYKCSSLGINYGLLIKEMNLLARSIIILDSNNVVRYIQIVKELTTEPNYADAINNLVTIVNSVVSDNKGMQLHKCIPCEAGTPPLSKEMVDKLILEVSDWQLVEDKKLVKEFKFKNFVDAKYFLDLLAIIAEEQGHHPNFTLIYNKLKVTLTTHSVGGLTKNDFVMAAIINDTKI